MTAALAAVIGVMILGASAASASQASPDQLRQGRDVYNAICGSCHQPTGAGIPGQFPPLKGNPAVQDAAYVQQVIRNGRSGQITVLGRNYNGVMPAQSTLTDVEIAGVVAYLQAGLTAPSAAPGASPAAKNRAAPITGALPRSSTMGMALAFLIAAGMGAYVLAPRIVGRNDHRNLPWLDAWLKTAVVVGYFVVATVIVPARLTESAIVKEMSRVGQDIIVSLVWLFALAFGLVALWIAQREDRI